MKVDYDITKQLQEDLIKAYNSVAPHCWYQLEAYKKTVKQPAPRYYITPKQAAQVISPMVQGNFELVNLMNPNRRRMYYSLFEKFIELSEKRQFAGKSLAYIMQFAVLEPAPEFFMTHNVVHRLRSYIKNGHLTNEGKVVNVKNRVTSYEKLKKKRAELRAFRAQFKTSIQ